ncbi:MAG: transposase [Planctomycetes bacterium]|jgi:transposase-like protein|nr:transposase [Planctomycetota bacterium]
MSKRRQLTGEQKVTIVREHLLEGVPVSDLCDKYQIHATQFYAWQKQLFENGASAFERKTNASNAKRQQSAQEQKIEKLEGKLQDRNEVVAELLEEHVKLKKASGEL